MADLFNRLTALTKSFLDRYPPGRRVSIIVMVLVTFGACVGLVWWAFRPQFKMLYTDLSLDDSAQIVKVLEEENVPYRLEQEGRRILVPANKVYAMRLKLAQSELPREKGYGWEIFDKTTLGVTDFVQKLNYRRALEGELARTILQIEPIEAARVHLVMPEESLFRETQKKTMASVTLRLRRGNRLTPAQVEGITYLVASAVEGLSPENVTVVDSRGYVLSEKVAPEPVARLTSTQFEMQQQVEAALVAKGQSLLDKRFGPGRSSLQVTAELDFRQTEQTREIYDADNPAVRSEETTITNATGRDTSSSSSEHSITNYELNLTRERSIGPVGTIKRLTIAAMVDGNYLETNQGDQAKREFMPLSPDEIKSVEQTLKAALGFSEQRGDEITVVSVPFQEVSLLEERELTTAQRWELWMRYGQKFVTLAAVVLLLLMVRSFFRKAQAVAGRLALPQLAPGAPAPGALPPSVDLAAQMTEEARSEAMLQEQVTRFATEKPEVAAKLIRSWLVE